MTMLENEKKEEVVAPEVTNEPSATSTNVNLSQKNEENPQKNENNNSNEDPNWKAFREARKRDRAEKEAAERRAAEKEAEIAALKAAMEVAFSKSSPTPQAYQQYYGINQTTEEETEEQRIERKLNELIAKREREQQKEREERERREFPQKLARDLPDFNLICSQENLDYLDFHYPEISRPLQRLQEGYEKWHDIYHAVKKLIPNHSNARKDAIKAEINSNKPKSISSNMVTPSGSVVKDSVHEVEMRRAENWARMQRIMKGVG